MSIYPTQAYGGLVDDWFVGAKYLLRVGREDGIAAAVDEAGSATTFATALAVQYTADQLLGLLERLEVRQREYAERLMLLNSRLRRLEQVDPAAAASLRAEFTALYGQKMAELNDMIAQIRGATYGLTGGARQIAEQVAGESLGVQFGAAPVAAAAAVPTVTVAAAATVALGLLYLLLQGVNFFIGRAEAAEDDAIRARFLASGYSPARAEKEVQKNRKARAKERATKPDPIEAITGAIPWVAAIVLTVYLAPIIAPVVAGVFAKSQ